MKIYRLKENQYLDSIFDKIPSNADIDKGKCGVGGTTLELKAERNSIIVVPNLSTIRSKKKQYDFIYVVNGDVSLRYVENYLKEITATDRHIKIMTTPESLYKIVKASDNLGYNLLENVFLLLDEFHSIVTEANYREDIIKVYDYFFQFKEKSRISATPYINTDPRFNILKQIKIKVENDIKKSIKIVYSEHIKATLKELANKIRNKQENAHIFYNSVDAIRQVVELIGEEEVSIFCSNNQNNIEKLEKYKGLLRDTSNGDFSPNRINLYTCGHYEGWDLIDDKATIIFVSDNRDEKTYLNIGIKGIQAIGRLRKNVPKEIFHVVNLKERQELGKVKTLEEISRINKIRAQKLINAYKTLNDEFDFKDEFNQDLMELMNKMIDFNPVTGEPVINLIKIDGLTYTTITGLQYANTHALANAWEEIGYKVEIMEDSTVLSEEDNNKLKNNRLGKSHKNKILINSLHNYRLTVDKARVEGKHLFLSDVENYMKENHTELFNFYNTLGYDKIVKLKYKSSLMREAYILQNETSSLVTGKIAKLLYSKYLLNQFYTCKEIKTYLEELYKGIGLTNTAKATDISKYFHIDTTTKSIDGGNKKGFILRYRKMSISHKSN